MGYVFDALKRSLKHDAKSGAQLVGDPAPAAAPNPAPQADADAAHASPDPGEAIADHDDLSAGDIVSPSDLGLDSEQAVDHAIASADAVVAASQEVSAASADFVNAALTGSGAAQQRAALAQATRQPAPPAKAAAPAEAKPQSAPAPIGPAAEAVAPAPTPAAPIADDITAWNGVEHVPATREIDERVVLLVSPATTIAEEYRAIRTSLMARWQQKRHLVHTITSAVPREGKTITAINLGLSFAELRNRRTLLIEGDLRNPSLSRLLSLPETPGLVGILTGVCEPRDAVVRVGGNKLCVLPAGVTSSDSAVQLLSSNELAELIQRVRGTFDHVIIDTPAVLELADAGILGALSDEVILVSRMHRTPRTIIDQAMQSLSSYNAPVGAMVATNERPRSRMLIGSGGSMRR